MSLGFVARGAVQVLATYGLVSTVLAVAVALAWPRIAHATRPAPTLARRLFRVRLAPALGGGVAATAALVAFALWEPRGDREIVGGAALALAALGILALTSGAWRAARALARTWRLDGQLSANASACLLHQPLPALLVDTAFPIVAVLGLVRPRLVVARQVADHCRGNEFQAIVAHELAHAGAFDNLRRLALVAAPDIMAWSRGEATRLDDWSAAAEVTADEVAAANVGRLHLAAALITVAKLAAAPPAAAPASALYRGEPVAHRIRRLLEAPAPGQATRPGRLGRPVLAIGALSAPLWLRAIHLAAESLLALP